MTLAEAYTVCRAIARREAKNFYYAFRVLPAHKRDAMCAVYAFMRRADDIADDETIPVATRRQMMAEWLEAWRASRVNGSRGDAVFVALQHTQQQFAIPDKLLEELVQGTSMDLYEAELKSEFAIEAEPGSEPASEPDPASGVLVGTGLRGYRTFDDLYRYCYLVASVVGLVCIRIFGYTDPRAEPLAEQTGIAFQLTNILRDVKEDAERGRLYLPLDMLTDFAMTPADVLSLTQGRQPEPNERGLIHGISARAWGFYASAGELLPLIDPDSRAALWVMVKIYSGLLARIDQHNGDVISERISLPTRAKLAILARGFSRALRHRVAA